MKYELYLLGLFVATISAQYICDVSTEGLLTDALTNPKTASFSGRATGPGTTFSLSTTSSFNIQMTMSGEQSIFSIDERDFGTNGVKNSAETSVLDWSRSALESGATYIKFDLPVGAVVVKMNYDPEWLNVSNPTIVVFSDNDTRLACYYIEALAPIRTPGETNGFAYRGVTTNSNTIGSLYFKGPSMAYWDISFASVAAPINQIDVPSRNPSATPNTSDANSVKSLAIMGLPLILSVLYLF
jgi:hypothetical protein